MVTPDKLQVETERLETNNSDTESIWTKTADLSHPSIYIKKDPFNDGSSSFMAKNKTLKHWWMYVCVYVWVCVWVSETLGEGMVGMLYL